MTLYVKVPPTVLCATFTTMHIKTCYMENYSIGGISMCSNIQQVHKRIEFKVYTEDSNATLCWTKRLNKIISVEA